MAAGQRCVEPEPLLPFPPRGEGRRFRRELGFAEGDVVIMPRTESDPARPRVVAQPDNVHVVTVGDDRVARGYLLHCLTLLSRRVRLPLLTLLTGRRLPVLRVLLPLL